MAKITYLLGAGASANTIPVVANMHSRIIEIVEELERIQRFPELNGTLLDGMIDIPTSLKTYNSTLDEIIKDLKWLLDLSKDIYSIDTLAKKVYLTQDYKPYERLKKCLIIYFTIEQFTFISSKTKKSKGFHKQVFDNRYDSFIATLADRYSEGLKLNNSIKILSWNYDLQLELSLKRFTGESISEIKQNFQVFPGINVMDGKQNIVDTKKFCLRKMNGNAVFTTGSKSNSELTIYDYLSGTNEVSHEERIAILLEEIAALDFNNNIACRFFNFAWEGEDYFKRKFNARQNPTYSDNIEEVERIASETEILVVIGYSFPIFNREIDNRIFRKMEKLKKVYIQDKNPEKIKSTMQNAFEILQREIIVNNIGTEVPTMVGDPSYYTKKHKVSFQLETSTDQFVIPYELNQ